MHSNHAHADRRQLKFGAFRRISLSLCAMWLVLGLACAEPFVPTDGEQVLERLRSSGLGSEGRDLRELRRQLTADPMNLALAEKYARQCIERSRSDSDPRYLGRAQAAIAPWWSVSKVPAN